MKDGSPIKEFENYIIYKNGSIYSIKRKQFLKPIKHDNGYYSVSLYKDGICKQFLIHRLVAETFLPNPNNLDEVDHIDCNPSNNNLNNLRWISKEDNLARSYDLLHQNHNKVKVNQLTLDGKIYKQYNSEADAFRETGIRHISEVIQGKRKTAGGFKWERGVDLSE